MLCASLWPDPADEHCPQAFRDAAAKSLLDFADKVRTDKEVMALCAKHWPRWRSTEPSRLRADDPAVWLDLRCALLDFIADFANWDAGTVPAFLATADALTCAAHGVREHGAERPLVVDPFAGGGAIPFEALRVGADVFASDLNPIPVALNKTLLEYIPKHGQRLADAVREGGRVIQRAVSERLSRFYPPDANGDTPIAYLWARTVRCEGPGCGVQLPLVRSGALSKKASRPMAMTFTANQREKRVDVAIASGSREEGTTRKGAVLCPVCDFTTANPRVRAQLAARRGGTRDARLLAVVSTRKAEQGRFYRLPTEADHRAIADALRRLEAGEAEFVPDEEIPTARPSPNARGLSAVTRIGIARFGDLFTARQAVALSEFVSSIRTVQSHPDLAAYTAEERSAAQVILAFALSRLVDRNCSLCRWRPQADQEKIESVFGRQALTIAWDFAEGAPLSGGTAGWLDAVEGPAKLVEEVSRSVSRSGRSQIASATQQSLPDDAADAIVTDPPYYDAIPYGDLSDFFYVWLRRCLHDRAEFSSPTTPKDEEAIWNPSRIYSVTGRPKDEAFYEAQMQRALAESRRVVRPDGIAVVVFAHKSTAGWEAILSALLKAGWVATASWPIDTEMGNRVNAVGTASLASSVHIVCRPRESDDGSARADSIGSWRAVLSELPGRIHDWLPRLAEEGVVGADAIFACIGPAVEIFSRYSRVEKASGDEVPLREYLEQVWAAVAREALSIMFDGADASGLEEDARLTAMWLWTLGAGTSAPKGPSREEEPGAESDDAEEDEEKVAKGKSVAGFVLEFDAARKIAQGLGAHLEKLTSVVEVKGDKARLLSVAERAKSLFTKSATDSEAAAARGKGKLSKKQLGLFAEIEAAEKEGLLGETGVPQVGETTLDRVHQAMILFAAGRSEAVRRFVVEEGVGKDARFWKLAQSLSALYPAGSDEKRWVDGVLARKRSLGF